MQFKHTTLATISIYFFCACMLAAKPSIQANLSPEKTPLNQPATLTIEIQNAGRHATPILPEHPDLSFISTGQSSQISIINGRMSSSKIFTYQINALKEGTFLIQPIQVKLNTISIQSSSLKLTILPPSQNQQSTTPNNQLKQQELEAIDESAFITIQRYGTNLKKHLYVGESVPVMIRVYLRQGLKIRDLAPPTLSTDAFTLSNLSKRPEQEQTTIEGTRFHTLTWHGNLSGIKSGDYPLAAEAEAIISIPSKRPQRRRNSAFNDPFFDHFFQHYENKELILKSDLEQTEVRSLPQEGRPKNFKGAVGSFIIKGGKFPKEIAAGEAINLKVSLEGKGNFDRLHTPLLEPEDSWKTYKEQTNIKDRDPIGYQAIKDFTIPAIATQAGDMEAQFTFSYFNPDLEEYKTIQTPRQKITVTGTSLSSPNIEKETTTAENSGSDLILQQTAGRSSAPPLQKSTIFWSLNIASLSLLLASFGARFVLSNHKRDPKIVLRRTTNKQLKLILKRMKTYQQQGEHLDFFKQCRLALQTELAYHIEAQPLATTIEDLKNYAPDHQDAIDVWTQVDLYEFATQSTPTKDLMLWFTKTQHALNALQKVQTSPKTPTQLSWGQTQ